MANGPIQGSTVFSAVERVFFKECIFEPFFRNQWCFYILSCSTNRRLRRYGGPVSREAGHRAP
eukprot:2770284-Amphidinium_carterae.1